MLRTASQIGTADEHPTLRVGEIRLSRKLDDYLPRRGPQLAEPALRQKRAEPFGQRASAHVHVHVCMWHVHAHTLASQAASIAAEHDRCGAPGGRQC